MAGRAPGGHAHPVGPRGVTNNESGRRHGAARLVTHVLLGRVGVLDEGMDQLLDELVEREVGSDGEPIHHNPDGSYPIALDPDPEDVPGDRDLFLDVWGEDGLVSLSLRVVEDERTAADRDPRSGVLRRPAAVSVPRVAGRDRARQLRRTRRGAGLGHPRTQQPDAPCRTRPLLPAQPRERGWGEGDQSLGGLRHDDADQHGIRALASDAVREGPMAKRWRACRKQSELSEQRPSRWDAHHPTVPDARNVSRW